MMQEDKQDKLYRCTYCKLEFYKDEKDISLRCPLCESIYVEHITDLETTNKSVKAGSGFCFMRF